jgi:hypothetical protein
MGHVLQLNKLEEVVFFWSASHKTAKPDEAIAADPHANTYAARTPIPTQHPPGVAVSREECGWL